MPFKWSSGRMPVQLGGREGDPTQDVSTTAWPRLEAEYLKKRLSGASGKYNTEGLKDVVAENVYLENVVQNHKTEANQELKHEFNLWLQGSHEANDGNGTYKNGEGKARRVYTTRADKWKGLPGDKDAFVPKAGFQIGDTMHNWKHTSWGGKQLTHLPGVRTYLREQAQSRSNAEQYLNILAEFGPQDLEQAWIYFKHWVKGKPATDVQVPTAETSQPGSRSAAFDLQPTNPVDGSDQLRMGDNFSGYPSPASTEDTVGVSYRTPLEEAALMNRAAGVWRRQFSPELVQFSPAPIALSPTMEETYAPAPVRNLNSAISAVELSAAAKNAEETPTAPPIRPYGGAFGSPNPGDYPTFATAKRRFDPPEDDAEDDDPYEW